MNDERVAEMIKRSFVEGYYAYATKHAAHSSSEEAWLESEAKKFSDRGCLKKSKRQ